jgi:hypothetical protein
MFLTILLLCVNFGISWFNCWSLGGMWAESKALGGFSRLLAWCGAIQAAVGFSSVFGAIVGFILFKMGYLPHKAANAAISLWYLLIIIPVIGSGLIITVQSWIAAYRERSISNMGVAAYNTFAQVHNMYEAIDGIGDAFSSVFDFFGSASSSDDDEGAGLIILVIGIVVFALLAGVVMTSVLIKKYSGRLEIPARQTI